MSAQTPEQEERLRKIVALAKRGEGGEKDAAIATVRRICEREGLSFDDVMSERAEKKEREIVLKEDEVMVCGSVIARYGCESWEDLQGVSVFARNDRKGPRFLRWMANDSYYIDALNAWEILKRAYKEEKKKIFDELERQRQALKKNADNAFRIKHMLFFQGERPEDSKQPMINEDPDFLRAMSLARGMKDVEIRKAIE